MKYTRLTYAGSYRTTSLVIRSHTLSNGLIREWCVYALVTVGLLLLVLTVLALLSDSFARYFFDPSIYWGSRIMRPLFWWQ
jgi:hypothetical protein